jgi:hypothetical protein
LTVDRCSLRRTENGQRARKAVIAGARKAVIVAAKKAVIAGARKAVIVAAKKAVIAGAKKAVIAGARKAVIAGARKAVILSEAQNLRRSFQSRRSTPSVKMILSPSESVAALAESRPGSTLPSVCHSTRKVLLHRVETISLVK